MTVPLARFVKRGHGPEDRAMICAARNEAHGFRGESWAEGPEAKGRTAQMIAACPQTRESASGARQPGVSAVSRGESRIRKAFTENWVSVERGLAETQRLGRGEKRLPLKTAQAFPPRHVPQSARGLQGIVSAFSLLDLHSAKRA